MKEWSRFVCLALLCHCASCSVNDGAIGEPLQGTRIEVGDTLPAFAVQTSDGVWVTRDSLLGKRSAVVFFHTQCGDCRRELPCVDSLYRACSAEEDFRLICIAREERNESIARFWEQHGFSMPYSPQNDRSVFQLFAYTNVPRIYISSPDGVVRHLHDDRNMPSFVQLMEQVASLRR